MLKASSKAISRAFSAFSAASGGRSTPGTVAVMRQVADAGGLKIDVATYPDALIDRDVIKKNLSATYSNRLRVAGVPGLVARPGPRYRCDCTLMQD